MVSFGFIWYDVCDFFKNMAKALVKRPSEAELGLVK